MQSCKRSIWCETDWWQNSKPSEKSPQYRIERDWPISSTHTVHFSAVNSTIDTCRRRPPVSRCCNPIALLSVRSIYCQLDKLLYILTSKRSLIGVRHHCLMSYSLLALLYAAACIHICREPASDRYKITVIWHFLPKNSTNNLYSCPTLTQLAYVCNTASLYWVWVGGYYL